MKQILTLLYVRKINKSSAKNVAGLKKGLSTWEDQFFSRTIQNFKHLFRLEEIVK